MVFLSIFVAKVVASVMCLRPISLPVVRCGRVVDHNVVPCGKCPECVDRKQKDMMQVFLNVASRTRDIVFSTFTYDDDHLPCMWSVHDYEACCINYQSFDLEDVQNHVDNEFEEVLGCKSLRRRDWRLWLKAARVAWFRKHGYNLQFTYVCIGEYSPHPDKRRPHYHCMFFGLNLSQVQELCSSWEYGFTFSEPVSHEQSLTGVCRYMAKYLYKGLFESDDVGNSFCEKPRVMASKNLVKIDSRFRSWLIGEDLGYSLDSVFISDFDARRLLDRRQILIDDFQYKLGKHYLDKIFKRYEIDSEGKRKFVNTPLQNALTAFIRKCADSLRDSRIREVESQSDYEASIALLKEFEALDEVSLLEREQSCTKVLKQYYTRTQLL